MRRREVQAAGNSAASGYSAIWPPTSWCSDRIPTTSKSVWVAPSRATPRRAIASAFAISPKPSPRLLLEPVRARRRRRRRDAPDHDDLPATDRKPRRAIRCARRGGIRRGDRCPGAGAALGTLEARAMNIGMVCYASVGGSGVVATELAHALAGRGHHVHIISSEPPFRWRAGVPRLSFTPVEIPSY